MNDRQVLLRQVLTYLSGSAGMMLFSFISFPLFARLLPVTEYGMLNLVMKTVMMVLIVSKLGLSHSLVRLFHQHAVSSDPAAACRYYATFYWSSVILGALSAFMFAAAVALTPAWVVSDPVKARLVCGSGLIFTTAVSQLLMVFYRAAERSRAYITVQLALKAAAIPVILVLMLNWERSSRAFLAGNTLVEAAAVCVLSWRLFRHTSLSIRLFDMRLFREMAAFGAPMIIFELGAVVLSSGDRFLVQRYLGSMQLGYYAAAYNLATACQDMIQGPLNLALVPMFTKVWQTKGRAATEELLSRSLNDFVMIAAVVLAGAFACSQEVMVVLGSRKYAPAAGLLPGLVCGLLLYAVATFFNAGLYLNSRTKTMAGNVMAAAMCNIVVNLLLLPRIGIMGAVYATVASCALLVALDVKQSRMLLTVRIPWRTAARCAIAATVAATLPGTVRLASPILALVAKGSIALLVYCAILWVLAPEVRTALSKAARRAWATR